ncbi:MAG TPA: DUF1592 domain-containing protein, partial [Planctomycetota bacterium]|nr:DUF1592 domain-containing protein [Planctomycetota bacterium]
MRIGLGVLALALAAPAAMPQESFRQGADVSVDQIRGFLARHCQECHGAEKPKPKGGFRLDHLSPDFSGKEGEERWGSVLEQLQSGAMPPKGKPRLSAEELRIVVDGIRGRLSSAESARRASQGRVVKRRLNRAEYTNTLRDLLGIEVDLRDLLALDTTTDGFDNVGAGLHLSSFALDRYLEAADRALSVAIVNRGQTPSKVRRYSLKTQHQVKNKSEDVFRIDGDTVICFTSAHYQRVHLGDFYPNEAERGTYKFRITVSAVQSGGKPVTFDVVSQTVGLVGYFDAPPDTPTVIEFTARVEPRTGISMLPYGLPMPQTVTKLGSEKYPGPGLAVHGVEIEGPIADSWPPAGHRRLLGDLPQVAMGKYKERLEVVSKDPMADAERILRAFVPRAFRRRVSEEEVRPYVALVKARLEESDSFEQAVRVALKAVLMSRDFLFLRERPGKLDDFALASRLSYFLWSTMPDDELLDLAGQGTLGRPEALRRQVERMLADPKAAAFTQNFLGQWLALRDIDFTEPNPYTYPEFDQMLKASMVRETELFFDEILKNNLSLTTFVDADFSMLNGRLGRHYGIAGVEGWGFRKVALPPESHRGGVLTMASVLKVTANGTTTSPITRGAWVLERILGTPPPKPPADVPPFEPDIRGATTLREQLAKHRSLPTCANCHSRIDPPGFALESFDVIGG